MLGNQLKNLFVHILAPTTVLNRTTDAHAYRVPGVGSMILQVLTASILGFIYTLKIYWRNFKDIIKNYLGKTVAFVTQVVLFFSGKY